MFKLYNLLISAADADIAVSPICKLVAATVPSTVTVLLDKVIKLVSPVTPMVLPEIAIVPAFNELPVIAAEVLIVLAVLIFPKPEIIEPTDRAPALVIDVEPPEGS